MPSNIRLLTKSRGLAAGAAGLLSLSIAAGASGAEDRLLDQDGKPVAGAWVVATREKCTNIMHCNGVCVEVKVAKTDEQGKYDLGAGSRAYNVTAYREGYLPAYRHVGMRGLKRIMQRGAQDPRFSNMDAPSARIAHVAKTASETSCWLAPPHERLALLPVYADMFREAAAIARFPEHHKEARGICRAMYIAKRLPSDPTYPPEAERTLQARYLDAIEPACNVPIDDSKEREILLAIEKGNVAPIRSAARDGFDFNRRLDGANPPIVLAARTGSGELVAELVKAGAKVDEFGADGGTALHRSLGVSRARRLDVVRALLEAGANPNLANLSGYPPLISIAAEKPGDPDLFRLLLKYGARVNQVISCQDCSDRGSGVLHRVLDPALARVAIEYGADVNGRTPLGRTPLMHAWPEVVKLLLDLGADPNIANKGGWTPLMYAVRAYETFPAGDHKQRLRQVPEMLVAAGARLNARNQHGVDAFYYTKDEALKERLRVLAAKR